MKTNRKKLIEVLEKRGYKNEDLINEIEQIYNKQQLPIHVVGSSAWYCKVENINGQWFEVITGLNETDVAIKIDKAFGKGTRFEIQNEFKLM